MKISQFPVYHILLEEGKRIQISPKMEFDRWPLKSGDEAHFGLNDPQTHQNMNVLLTSRISIWIFSRPLQRGSSRMNPLTTHGSRHDNLLRFAVLPFRYPEFVHRPG
jgi:hypothetical protein